MPDTVIQPWPWYVAGPLMGSVALALLVFGGRALGISASYRTMCAIVAPRRVAFFDFDWRGRGGWNLAFALGVAGGGFLAVTVLGTPDPASLSAAARADLAAAGVTDFSGLVPADLFSWDAVLSIRGAIALGLGGFLVGFGASYAGGCTSGHGIMGLADLQPASAVAVISFFVGGALSAHLLLPILL